MSLTTSVKQILSSRNVRNGAIYTLFSFVNRGLGFILVLLLAGFLTTNDYGSLNLFTTFVTLVGIFITLGTSSFVSIAFFRKSREELNKIIGFALFITTIVLIFLSMAILMFPNFFQKIVGINVEYLFIALFICYSTEISNLNLNLWQLEEKPVAYGLFTLLMALGNFALTIWFIICLNMNWEGRAYSQLIVSIAMGIYSFWFIIRRKYFTVSIFNKSLIFETFAYGLPLLPHMMSFWFKQGCDRYIINFYWEASYVGIYSFALNFASIIGMIGSAFNASNSVYIFKNLAIGYKEKKESLKRITIIMSSVFGGIFLVVWLGAIFFIPQFIPKYTSCTPLLLPICLGAFAQCIYLLYVNYLFYFKKTKQLMYITFSTAILQFILSLILTRYSIVFTAYVSMLISILTCLSVTIFAKRILEREENQRKSLDSVIS